MDQKQIRITDAITSEYSDFLSYCIASGKVFVSELSNVDFVAFRTSSGQTRDYVRAIRAQLDNPIILENKHPEKDISLLCEEEVHTSSSLPIRMESEIIDTASADIEGFLNDDIDSAVLQTEPTDTQPEISAVGAEALSTKAITAETNMLQQTGDKESNQLCVAAPSTIFLDEPVGEPEISLAKLLEVNASDFAEIRLDLLNLGVRSTNCLKLAKCKTIADVLRKSENDLRGIRNMGIKSVNEVLQKVKDFVSGPENIEFYAQSKEGIGEPGGKRVSLDSAFKATIESLLMGEDYSIEGLTEDQVDLFKKLSTAVDILGEEICLEAYLNPEYAIQICNTFRNFSISHIRYEKALEEANRRVSHLTDFMRERKALPFIQAYEVRAGDKLSHLISKCSEETTISCVPLLYKGFCQEENMLTLFAETTKFLGWLSFDVNSLITSISENMRKLLMGRSERALDVFTLRTEGKTLEEVGSRYGVTRERIRQIELKVFRTFWDVYSRQKYDLVMLIYALRDALLYEHSSAGGVIGAVWYLIGRCT